MDQNPVLRVILIVLAVLIALWLANMVLHFLGVLFFLAIRIAVVVAIAWVIVHLLTRKKSYLA